MVEWVRGFIYGTCIILFCLFLIGTCYRVIDGQVP